MLTFLMVFSLLAQGFASYAEPTPAKAVDHPIISATIHHNAMTVVSDVCCDEEIQETTTTSCNGGDCKFYFSNISESTSRAQNKHLALNSSEKFSFYNLVSLRPPRA
ncbi:MAG: hypothetical protein ABJK39_11920 [Hyphomicrobiales bacterium]